MNTLKVTGWIAVGGIFGFLVAGNHIYMDMREILDVVQWVIFTALGYHLFDKYLEKNMERIEGSVLAERDDRREDVREVRARSEEILDRVHNVEQIVIAIQNKEEE